MRRRLPVVQNEASEDSAAAARPPFQWMLIGGGLTVAIWAPLVALSLPIGARLAARALHVEPHELPSAMGRMSPRENGAVALIAVLPAMVAFLVAAALAGALVGRFGGRAGPREAAFGGLFAAALVSLLSLRPALGYSAAGIGVAFAVLSTLGALGGALGGISGRRLRR